MMRAPESRRRFLASILSPVIIVWCIWFPYMAYVDGWHYFITRAHTSGSKSDPTFMNSTSFVNSTIPFLNSTASAPQAHNKNHDGGYPFYALSITMVFGSLVAGATSEGGASVAFPVMVLLLGIKPKIARVSIY